MTTPAAARLYEAQHLYEMEGKGFAYYNPHDKPIMELPVIYGFCNGGSPGWMSAISIDAEGYGLAGHACSSEAYMPHDLGMLANAGDWKHEIYREKFPDGFRCEWVPSSEMDDHEGLQRAIRLGNERHKREQESNAAAADVQEDVTC